MLIFVVVSLMWIVRSVKYLLCLLGTMPNYRLFTFDNLLPALFKLATTGDGLIQIIMNYRNRVCFLDFKMLSLNVRGIRCPQKKERLCSFGFRSKMQMLYSYRKPTVRKKLKTIGNVSGKAQCILHTVRIIAVVT